MPQKPYDPEKVITTFGLHTARKFAEDSMIAVNYDSDQRGLKKNVDGGARHVEYKDLSGTISVFLGENSPTNAKLQFAHEAKMQFSCVIQDKTHVASGFASADVMVRKVPGFIRGKDPEDLEWILQFTQGKISHTEPKSASTVPLA